jgi:hypothetical protein
MALISACLCSGSLGRVVFLEILKIVVFLGLATGLKNKVLTEELTDSDYQFQNFPKSEDT